jgi:hypothetical protein
MQSTQPITNGHCTIGWSLEELGWRGQERPTRFPGAAKEVKAEP